MTRTLIPRQLTLLFTRQITPHQINPHPPQTRLTLRSLKRITTIALLPLAALTLPCHSNARALAGYEFPEIIPATAEHNEMRLNGAAIRTMYYLVDAYAGLLYIENPGHDPQALIAQNTSKRLVYHILVNRVSGRRIATAMYESLQLNLTEEEANAMDARLQRLVEMFDIRIVRGDVGYVEYVPERQVSRIVINSDIKGEIEGKDLFDALMRIWIGEHPVSAQFKRGVLGLEDTRTDLASEEN